MANVHGVLLKELLCYGMACEQTGIRKWWNPLRLFKGNIYTKTIPVRKIINKESKP